jgi:hypothetical protein
MNPQLTLSVNFSPPLQLPHTGCLNLETLSLTSTEAFNVTNQYRSLQCHSSYWTQSRQLKTLKLSLSIPPSSWC